MLGLEYNSLRNFVSSVEEALDTNITISTYKNKVTIGIYDDGYNYRGTFSYDGTAIINGESKHIAENRDGHLYMERTDFYDVMGIENEQYNAPVEEYTNLDAAFSTLINTGKDALTSWFVGVIKIGGAVITAISSYDDVLSKIDEKSKEKTVGFYYDESVVGEVYNSTTDKYEAICTYTTYQLANDSKQRSNWNFFVSYTENFGVGYQNSMFEEVTTW